MYYGQAYDLIPEAPRKIMTHFQSAIRLPFIGRAVSGIESQA